MLGFLKRMSLLNENNCFEEEVLSGERLICFVLVTESRMKEDLIFNKINDLLT